MPLLNADVVHHDTISEFDFDAEHALVTNHTVLYVCLISDRHTSTDKALRRSLTNTVISSYKQSMHTGHFISHFPGKPWLAGNALDSLQSLTSHTLQQTELATSTHCGQPSAIEPVTTPATSANTPDCFKRALNTLLFQ